MDDDELNSYNKKQLYLLIFLGLLVAGIVYFSLKAKNGSSNQIDREKINRAFQRR